jgi:hypothetical protein
MKEVLVNNMIKWWCQTILRLCLRRLRMKDRL